MNGRLEHYLENQEKNKRRLEGRPEYLKGFYYSLSDMQETSKRDYILYVINFLDYMNYPLEENLAEKLTYDNFNMYLSYLSTYEAKKGLKNLSSRKVRISAIKRFHKYLYNRRILSYIFWDEITAPRERTEERQILSLNEEEIKEIIDNIESGIGTDRMKARQSKWIQRDKLLVMLPILTGLRVTALSEINLNDINIPKREIIVIEKENARKTIYFNSYLEEEMKEWLYIRKEILKETGGNSEALFITKWKGSVRRIHTNSIREIVKKYTQTIDKPITPHKLRTTYGNMVYQETGDISKASEAMGHQSVSITKKYYVDTKVKPEEILKRMDKFTCKIGIRSGIIEQ